MAKWDFLAIQELQAWWVYLGYLEKKELKEKQFMACLVFLEEMVSLEYLVNLEREEK